MSGPTGNNAITPQSIVTGYAKAVSANTSYSAPTTAVQLLASQANGARLTSVTALALATVAATELQLFSSPDNGATFRFVKSVQMPAYTVAQTTGQAQTDFLYSESNPLFLAPGESLYFAIGVALAAGIEARCHGGAY